MMRDDWVKVQRERAIQSQKKVLTCGDVSIPEGMMHPCVGPQTSALQLQLLYIALLHPGHPLKIYPCTLCKCSHLEQTLLQFDIDSNVFKPHIQLIALITLSQAPKVNSFSHAILRHDIPAAQNWVSCFLQWKPTDTMYLMQWPTLPSSYK